MNSITGFLQNSDVADDFSHMDKSRRSGNYFFSFDEQVLESNFSKFERKGITLFILGNVYKYLDTQIDNVWFSELIFREKLQNLNNELSKIDGYYSLVIIDRINKKTSIITDRLGMSPFYIYESHKHALSWGTDIRLMLKEIESIELDKPAICSYLDISHFLGDSTPYKKIKRIKPASIISINNIDGSIIKSERYWSWSNIKRIEIDFDTAVDRLYDLFIDAVSARLERDKQYCLTLSGGLDSRALLGAINQLDNYKVSCLTFGIPTSPDVMIATSACKVVDIEHKVVEISKDHWVDGRKAGVLATAGMKSLFHMHVLNSLNEIKSMGDHVINGYLGDLTLGGGYLRKKFSGFKTAKEIAEEKFGEHIDFIDFDDEYYNHESSDPIFIYHRGVRFTSMGTDLVSESVVNLKPFVDNRLLEFVYSLDDSYRFNGKLYHSMLVKYFPELFATIPWQATGNVIRYNRKDSNIGNIYSVLRPKLIKIISYSQMSNKVRKFYNFIKNNKTFVDYQGWIHEDKFKKTVDGLLLHNSEVSLLLGDLAIRRYVDLAFDHGKIEPLGCLMSLEIFLNEVKHDS
jgi:asparagine synthase (glutamine-hydrolysing)